MDNPVGSKLAD